MGHPYFASSMEASFKQAEKNAIWMRTAPPTPVSATLLDLANNPAKYMSDLL
ncbi:hypothetical protein [Alicyclobacillus acidiphilus]|uniref:hypothetical protein n=1 Tax=Alicyclobacillus acidiphilus TaxID=182455 RepID=UPI0012ED1C14|nr:hypothetical protein [Alicyclobacillus acidiphilus]